MKIDSDDLYLGCTFETGACRRNVMDVWTLDFTRCTQYPYSSHKMQIHNPSYIWKDLDKS